MSMSFYRATVPVYQHMLKGLDVCLAKGAEFAKAREMADADFLAARLHPDMYPLIKQIQIASDHAKGGPARALGIDAPVYADDETTIDEAKARIAKTLAFLDGVSKDDLDAAADRRVTYELMGAPMEFSAAAFVLHFSLPNFYFHVVTAYDVMRAMGVKLGKADFFGATLIQE